MVADRRVAGPKVNGIPLVAANLEPNVGPLVEVEPERLMARIDCWHASSAWESRVTR